MTQHETDRGEPELGPLLTRLVVLYPWHRLAFIGINGALALANVMTGAPWWSVWPLMITAGLFIPHYLFWKSVSVGERWADARADELTERSYDKSHLDLVIDRHTPPRPAQPKRGNH